MPEDKGKTNKADSIQANEERILKRIENSIKNDGIKEELAEKFLYSERLTIPALRFTMLQMVSSAGEGYAGFFFEILQYLEREIKEKRLPPGEAGDLSQSYFRIVKSLSDRGFPIEELNKSLEGEGAPDYPTPWELNGLLCSFQEKEKQAFKEGRKAAEDAGAQGKAIGQAVEELKESMDEKCKILLEMAGNLMRAEASIESSQGILTESIKEALSLSEEKDRKFQVFLEEAAVKEKHIEEMLLQLEKKAGRLYGMQENIIKKEEPSFLNKAFSQSIPAFFRGIRKGKTGKKEEIEAAAPKEGGKRDAKELIFLLKKHNCPMEVRETVVSALRGGVPPEEVCLAVEDSYKEGGEGDGMLKDVIEIMLLYQNQKEGEIKDE